MILNNTVAILYRGGELSRDQKKFQILSYRGNLNYENNWKKNVQRFLDTGFWCTEISLYPESYTNINYAYFIYNCR